jgi:hypothetical protein
MSQTPQLSWRQWIRDKQRHRRARLGIVKANEYSRFSALKPAERGGNSRAKTVELQPALVREQAVLNLL